MSCGRKTERQKGRKTETGIDIYTRPADDKIR